MAKTKERDEDLLNPGEPAEPPVKQPLTVSLDDDSDDAPEPEAESPETRKGRRQQFREMRDTLKRNAEELAELRGRLSAPQPIVVQAPPPQQQSQPDPLEAADEEAWEQMQATLRALATPNLPEAEDQRLRKQYRTLERKRHDIGAEAAARRVASRQPQPSAEDSDNKHLVRSFPKIMNDDALRLMAQGRAIELARTRRVPMSIEIATEACEAIYTERGFRGNKPAPASDIERARHAGVSSRPAASGSGGNNFTPNKSQEKFALSMYAHRKDLSDEQKIRMYHDKVLKPAGLA